LGTLTLPTQGAVYVDANAIIYRVEAVQPYLYTSAPLWDALRAGHLQVITSELSLLEVLVKPLQLGNLDYKHCSKMFFTGQRASPAFRLHVKHSKWRQNYEPQQTSKRRIPSTRPRRSLNNARSL
jgi:hypothetical protein